MIFRVSYSGRPGSGVFVEAETPGEAAEWLRDFWGPHIAGLYGTPPVAVAVDGPERGYCVHAARKGAA